MADGCNHNGQVGGHTLDAALFVATAFGGEAFGGDPGDDGTTPLAGTAVAPSKACARWATLTDRVRTVSADSTPLGTVGGEVSAGCRGGDFGAAGAGVEATSTGAC